MSRADSQQETKQAKQIRALGLQDDMQQHGDEDQIMGGANLLPRISDEKPFGQSEKADDSIFDGESQLEPKEINEESN